MSCSVIRDWGLAARAGTVHRRRQGAVGCAVILVVAVSSGCASPPETALQQLVDARQRTADLMLNFSTAADAGNRAVMAHTDEASVTFAREAAAAADAAAKDAAALGPLLDALGYTDETRLLKEFATRFAEYRTLDRDLLDLAIENSNLKAQRLAFGPAQTAVDGFRVALDSIATATTGESSWRAQALAAQALAAVREIQVLQAPHNAEADDEAMTRMEAQMKKAETAARTSLQKLATATPPASKPQLAAATGALDSFMDLNRQIVELSRRNTNVRSLALALGQKRTLTAACQDSLRALQEALENRGFKATR